MSNVAVERVLVVPTAEFHALGYFQGFSIDVRRYLPRLLSPDLVSFRPRSEMERDPGFKQLIPYVLLQHCDESGRETLFQYTRGQGQGEGRLHLKRSVGIGGHISSDDLQAGPGEGTFQQGMEREVSEEVEIGTSYNQRCVGLINDDQTEVGQVHLGIVHVFDLVRPAVRPRESELVDSGFRPVNDLLEELAGFESWSQITLAAVFGANRTSGGVGR